MPTGLPAGLHRHTGRADEAFMRYVIAARPPFVKMLNPGQGENNLAGQCLQLGVQTIGRIVTDHQYVDGAKGGDFIREVIAAAHACPNIHYWELYNEEFQGGVAMRRYSDLSITFMRYMKEMGRSAVIGCFSTGQPQVDQPGISEWSNFGPALNMAADDGHCLGLHEYSATLMWWGVNQYQWDWAADRPNGNWPGPPPTPNRTNEGWWTLRYRKHVREMRRLGIRVPNILITEGGNDDIQPRPGPQGKGWRDWAGMSEVRQFGDWASQCAWYAQELALDPYVKGWVTFGWATADPTWNSFDDSQTPAEFERFTEVMSRLSRGTTPAPTPTPAEQPLVMGAVLAGETWWKHIAKRIYGSDHYGRVVAPLMNANSGVQLKPRVMLLLPGFRAVRDPRAPVIDPYGGAPVPILIPRAGDTFASIAVRVGCTANQLKAANPWLAGRAITPTTPVFVPGYRIERG